MLLRIETSASLSRSPFALSPSCLTSVELIPEQSKSIRSYARILKRDCRGLVDDQYFRGWAASCWKRKVTYPIVYR